MNNNFDDLKKLINMSKDENLQTVTDLKKFLDLQNKLFKRKELTESLFYSGDGIDVQLEYIKESKKHSSKLFCVRIKQIKEEDLNSNEVEIEVELRYCLINMTTGELQWS